MFGVVFSNRSFPIDIYTFTQIDTFHRLLDMKTFVGNFKCNQISSSGSSNSPRRHRRRRIVRFDMRSLNLHAQQLHSSDGQSPSRLHPIPGLMIRWLQLGDGDLRWCWQMVVVVVIVVGKEEWYV
ncbi:hypothetical protein R6Q57_016791 [Mikania cordata]